jgi:hypothetical protein
MESNERRREGRALKTLGIDPGLRGALALYSPGELTVFDVPTIRVSKKDRVDAYQLGNWLDLHRNTIKRAVIELVSAMPKQGVTSSFNFGFVTGVLHGLLAGNQIPMVTVPAVVWKRHFGLIGQDKDASRMAASRIAPAFAHHWTRKKDDGRAEAFLLALYGEKIAT